MDVGIFLIATGQYIDFVEPLVSDIEKYFLLGHTKSIYVFSDSAPNIKGVQFVKTEHKPWPYPTLYRYHLITEFCNAHNIQHDYYYYLDVDMRIVDFVGDEILGELVATKHPGFYRKLRLEYPVCNVFLSHCYTPFPKVVSYYAGAVNGGSTYLKMASTIKEWIDLDAEFGFVPDWHDEGYLNKYLALYPPTISLDPSYCYPDNEEHVKAWGLRKLTPKIKCLYKENRYTNGRNTVS